MSKSTDGQIEEMVKARWLEIGLSQTDLAEALGAAPAAKRSRGPGNETDRLSHLADALGISAHLFNGHGKTAAPAKSEPPERRDESLQALLELRLLRLFHEVRDHNTKRMLIQLVEQIVRRQATGNGHAS